MQLAQSRGDLTVPGVQVMQVAQDGAAALRVGIGHRHGQCQQRVQRGLEVRADAQQRQQRRLQLGASIQPDPSPHKMLDQLQTPLLALLKDSPDFQPALDPLLAMSLGVASSAPARSRAILADLHALYPANRQIAQALSQLP